MFIAKQIQRQLLAGMQRLNGMGINQIHDLKQLEFCPNLHKEITACCSTFMYFFSLHGYPDNQQTVMMLYILL